MSGSQSRRERHIEIPVAYGGEAGPDLAEVAEWAGIER